MAQHQTNQGFKLQRQVLSKYPLIKASV